jgi:hypothetical protein
VIRSAAPGDTVRFLNVRAAFRQRDRGIVVGSEGTTQIVFFDSTGAYRRSLGRRGSGPGDLLQVYNLMPMEEDSILLDNSIDLRVLAPDGGYVRTVRLERGGPGSMMTRFGRMADGTIVGADWPQGHEQTDARWLGTSRIFALSPEAGQVAQVGLYPAVEYAKGPERLGGVYVVFGPTLVAAVGSSRYCLSYPVRHELSCYDSAGTLRSVIRRNVAARPTPAEMIDRYREAYNRFADDAGAGSSMQAQRRAILAASLFADSLPGFDVALFDRLDHLWIREYDPQDEVTRARGRSDMGTPVRDSPSRWSVVAPDGRWLGDLTIPARFTPLDIGPDYLLGVSRDDDDVESIVSYALRRTP